MTVKRSARRQFLKNTTLTALGLGVLSTTKANATEPSVRPESGGDCAPTTLDAYGQGPFYTADAPFLTDNKLAAEGQVGTRMIISGRVRDIGCTEVIPDTLIDIWQADDAAVYDNSGFTLRGKVLSNAQGFYLFETIYPGKYLNGSAFRPSHIHFKITPPGYPTLTTQLYFAGDPDLTTDAASSVTSGVYDATERIITLEENEQGILEGTWDIVIDGDGVAVGIEELRLERGMIYSVGPNPYADQMVISYGVFQEAMVSLSIYDLSGREVAVLEQRRLTPEKYEAIWSPDAGMPAGHYFLVLAVNGLQVHHLKVVKE